MVRDALLARAPIPAINIHPIPTEGLSPEMAADTYERELKKFYGAAHLDPGRPLFDVNLLGLGTGWTYSLVVPGQPGASGTRQVGFRRRWRQARSAYHTDLSGAREQPACSLPGRRRREAGDIQAASPRRRHPAGGAVFIRPARCGCSAMRPRTVENQPIRISWASPRASLRSVFTVIADKAAFTCRVSSRRLRILPASAPHVATAITASPQVRSALLQSQALRRR